MRGRRGRLGWAVVAAGLALGACGSSGHTAAPPAGAPSTVTPTSTVTSVVPSVPATTTPGSTTLDPVRLRSLLVTAADLPAGFTSATAADLAPLAPCGHAVLPLPSGVEQAQAAFDRNGGLERAVEQVAVLGPGPAAALVDQVRQVDAGCRQFDQTTSGRTVTLLVTPIAPAPAGDTVAGVQLADSAHFTDLIVVRSGGIDAVVVITETGNPAPPATVAAIVAAAAARLGTG